ncbi:hypothetical protein V8687_03915 [Shewanella baltica]|uniref:hypothetical protein n=1 Tax=Shewanella baltica TaxID=62322 RepID=UPI0030CE51AE
MTNLHRQRGFGVASMLGVVLALGAFGFFLMELSTIVQTQSIKSKGKMFYAQIADIRNAIRMHQVDKIAQGQSGIYLFPAGWNDLVPNYLPDCSTTDNQAGRCRIPSQTGWGGVIALTRVAATVLAPSHNLIVIPLPPVNAEFKFEHDVHVSELLQLPFARYNESANTVSFQVHRNGDELEHDGLVKRSGDDSTLTGDWDVGGNYAITNVKDVIVRNSDGSQRSLAAGTVAMVAKHDQRIDKHKCPSGLTPDIVTGIKGMFNTTTIPIVFQNISASRSYTVASSAYWTVKLDYFAEFEGIMTELHDGEVNVTLICKP